jgi:hypothetical protein
MKKKKNHTIAWWKKKLWRIFTLYVKEKGNWTCFTCGKVAVGSGMAGGHFISAAACPPSLYFHEDNVRPQCSHCNLVLEGNHYLYGVKLGKRIVNKLYKLKEEKRGEVWTQEDYQKQIKRYEQKYKDIKQTNLEGARRSREDSIGAR